MIPGNGEANEARAEAIRLQARTQRLEIILVSLALVAVVLAAGTATFVGLQSKRQQDRIEDCTNPKGRCYKQDADATAKAVQTILDYQQDLMAPHRLRNEAENLCNVVALVEVTLTLQGRHPVDVNVVLDHYRHCVLENSGNTPAPPLPENPLTTTTTREPPP